MNKIVLPTKRFQITGKFFCGAVVALLLVALRASAESVTIAWTPSTNPGVTGFKVYYGPASRVYMNTLTVGTASNIVIPQLAAGKKYYIAVTSCDATGAESPFSDEVVYLVPLPVAASNSNVPVPAATTVASTTPVATNPSAAATTNPSASPKAKATPRAGGSNSPQAPAKSSPAPAPAAAPSPAPKPFTVAAKAKVGAPTKLSSAKPAATVAELSPAPAAKPLVTNLKTPAPANPAPTLAATVATRATLFYAAVAPFDWQLNGRLDEAEKIALMDALLKRAQPLTVIDVSGINTDAEAAEVTLWIAALYQQIARFDVNHDGQLLANEQAALAARLEADERLLPLFAPLMLETAPVSTH